MNRVIDVEDPWRPFEGMYPAPTEYEMRNLMPFLYKYEFEDDDFDEDADPDWVNLKRKYQCPNLRNVLIEILRIARESKGYDVDFRINIIPSPFIPRRLDQDKKSYEIGVTAAQFVISEINLEMMGSGLSYMFVSLDKLVQDRRFKMYMTITAREIDANRMEIDDKDEDGIVLRTIQALAVENPGCQPCDCLYEWRFKVDDFNASACLEEAIQTRLRCLSV